VGVTVFLPCRYGSERVQDKNKRRFGKWRRGLIQLKLQQLDGARLVDSVIVSTDDQWIYDNASRYSKISVHWRNKNLCQNTTSTDDLIPHAAELIPDGDILWTHCTSPFVTAQIYDDMIHAYRDPGDHDSLMTVQSVQGFYWRDGVPINYSRAAERWPRTQTIEPMYKVTSGGFIASSDIYREHGDRIGKHPKLFEVSAVAAMDIDTPEDFALAERLAS